MCSQIASLVGADAIVALQQTHSNFGMIINQPLEQDQLYAGSGDFMITQTVGLALAIFTADCIPLVIYSPLHKAVALVHIGWRGAVGEIVQKVLDQAFFKNNRDTIKVFFGPAALDCCYKVQKDFLDQFDNQSKIECFIFKNEKIFYNNSRFVSLILKNLGILELNIYTNYNICTICSEQYCSYRQDKEKAKRNVTVALLQ